MSFDDIKTACVLRYPYLWAHEAARGETEGRKPRAVSVGVRIPRQSGDLLLLFPITSKEPAHSRLAVEIPASEKRRAGLDDTLRLWIILDEYNADLVGRSFYLEPRPPLGRFSKSFFLPLMRTFVAARRQAQPVERQD
jgi:hypothetical protein